MQVHLMPVRIYCFPSSIICDNAVGSPFCMLKSLRLFSSLPLRLSDRLCAFQCHQMLLHTMGDPHPYHHTHRIALHLPHSKRYERGRPNCVFLGFLATFLIAHFLTSMTTLVPKYEVNYVGVNNYEIRDDYMMLNVSVRGRKASVSEIVHNSLTRLLFLDACVVFRHDQEQKLRRPQVQRFGTHSLAPRRFRGQAKHPRHDV